MQRGAVHRYRRHQNPTSVALALPFSVLSRSIASSTQIHGVRREFLDKGEQYRRATETIYAFVVSSEGLKVGMPHIIPDFCGQRLPHE